MGFDGDVEIMVPAMDLEGLWMARLIGNEDLWHVRDMGAESLKWEWKNLGTMDIQEIEWGIHNSHGPKEERR